MNNRNCGMQLTGHAPTIHRMVITMSRNNVCFLITLDDREDIGNGLQDFGDEVPGDCQYRVQEIPAITDSVQGRLA